MSTQHLIVRRPGPGPGPPPRRQLSTLNNDLLYKILNYLPLVDLLRVGSLNVRMGILQRRLCSTKKSVILLIGKYIYAGTDELRGLFYPEAHLGGLQDSSGTGQLVVDTSKHDLSVSLLQIESLSASFSQFFADTFPHINNLTIYHCCHLLAPGDLLAGPSKFQETVQTKATHDLVRLLTSSKFRSQLITLKLSLVYLPLDHQIVATINALNNLEHLQLHCQFSSQRHLALTILERLTSFTATVSTPFQIPQMLNILAAYTKTRTTPLEISLNCKQLNLQFSQNTFFRMAAPFTSQFKRIPVFRIYTEADRLHSLTQIFTGLQHLELSVSSISVGVVIDALANLQHLTSLIIRPNAMIKSEALLRQRQWPTLKWLRLQLTGEGTYYQQRISQWNIESICPQLQALQIRLHQWHCSADCRVVEDIGRIWKQITESLEPTLKQIKDKLPALRSVTVDSLLGGAVYRG